MIMNVPQPCRGQDPSFDGVAGLDAALGGRHAVYS